MGMRRYVQTPGPVGEFSELPLWQRAVTMDLVYVGYGLLVVVLVLVSYLLGAFGWLPTIRVHREASMSRRNAESPRRVTSTLAIGSSGAR